MPTKKKEELVEEEDILEEEMDDEDIEEGEPSQSEFEEEAEAKAVPEKEEDLDLDEPASEPKPDAAAKEAFNMTADVPVQVVAVLGKKTVSVKELVGLKMGQVIDLARPVNETVDLVAGGKLVAKGELVDIDGKMGVRVTKLVR